MAVEGLTIEIRGDSEDLQKSIKSAYKSLEDFEKKMGTKVAQGSDKAAYALTNLSRVAQDAPFGFIAIQNNLSPLLESFQRLQADTKDSGGALKSLMGALTGPAGIGVAFSLVTAAVSFATIGFGAWTRMFKPAKAMAEDLTKTLNEYVNSLDDVSKANLKGAENAQDELVKLQFLYQASQDHNLALKERKKAVDDLQKLYPTYFGNIKDETILAGGAKTAYDNLTQSILESARARASEQIMAENQKKMLVIEAKLATAAQNRKTAWEALQRAEANANILQKQGISGGTAQAVMIDTQLVTATENYNQANEEAIFLAKQWNDINRRNVTLAGNVTQKVRKFGEDILGGVKDKLPKVKIPIEPTVPNMHEIGRMMEQVATIAPIKGVMGLDLEKFKQDFEHINIDTTQLEKVRAAIEQIFYEIETAKANKKIEQLADTVNSLVIPAFNDLYDAILKGEDPLQAFFKGLGQAVEQLIQKLIQAAIQAAILSLISNMITGGTPMSFMGAFGKIMGMQSGGIVTGPTLAMVGEGPGTSLSNPEVVSPLKDLRKYLGSDQTQIVVTSRLRGNDMILQNERTVRKQNRIH